MRTRWTTCTLMVLMLPLPAACGDADQPDDALAAIRAPEIATIAPARQAVSGIFIPSLDPVTLNDAEIAKVTGVGPVCLFRYTSAGRPVLAAGMARDGAVDGGVVKLNGYLVPLAPAAVDPPALPGTMALVDGPVRLLLLPDPGAQTGQREATLMFEVADSLRVGYRGWLECPAP